MDETATAGSAHDRPDPDTGRRYCATLNPLAGPGTVSHHLRAMQRSSDSSSVLFIKKLSMPGDITRMRPITLSCRKSDSFAQLAE